MPREGAPSRSGDSVELIIATAMIVQKSKNETTPSASTVAGEKSLELVIQEIIQT